MGSDFLVLDLPPGTGDVALTMAQKLKVTGVVMVTTPQEVALQDVYKSVSMCTKLSLPILGVIENMSYFVPPDMPEKKYHIFGEGGGARVAAEYEVPFLGEVPIDVRVRQGGDDGFPFVLDPESGSLGDAFRGLASNVISEVRRINARTSASTVEISL